MGLYVFLTLDANMFQGYFSKSDAKMIRKVYRKLCAEVATSVTTYLDAFCIPNECLNAPIAHKVYSRL